MAASTWNDSRVDLLRFGENAIGKPYFSEGGSWRRKDTYTPYDERPAITETRFAAGPVDDSPAFGEEAGGYDSRCVCCWFGFSHTLALHERSVTDAAKQS